ncbi:uncharacterized protein LOC141851472 [Brevipalpus obovatus]|uniref:uncharacterized protein LOC141851472 n=1 Tax=Brevipalpus obovatus TaxID=246614 RepID=UPI003D9F481B
MKYYSFGVFVRFESSSHLQLSTSIIMTTPSVKNPPRSTNRNLRRQLESERIKVEELELDCISKDEQISKLIEEKDLCKARIRSLNDVFTNMVEGDDYERMKNDFDALKRNHEMIVNECKFYQKCAKDLEDEIKSVYENNNELNNKIEFLLKDIEKLVQENLELNHLRAKYDDLCDKMKVISEDNDELRRSLEAYREQARRELSTESIAGSHLSIDTAVNGFGEPVSLFSELMQKDRDEELEKSRKLIESMKQEIEDFKAKVMDIDRLKEENVAITAQKNLLLQQINDLFCKRESFHSTREVEKHRSNEHIKHLKEILIQRDDEIANLRSDRESERRENKNLKNKIEEMENELKALDHSITLKWRSKERFICEKEHLEAMLREEQQHQQPKVSEAAENHHKESQTSLKFHDSQGSECFHHHHEPDSLVALIKSNDNTNTNGLPVERMSTASSPPPRLPPRHNLLTTQVDNRMTINVITSPVSAPNVRSNDCNNTVGGIDAGYSHSNMPSNFVRGSFCNNSINVGSPCKLRCNREDHINYAHITTLRNSHMNLHHHHHHIISSPHHVHRSQEPCIQSEEESDHGDNTPLQIHGPGNDGMIREDAHSPTNNSDHSDNPSSPQRGANHPATFSHSRLSDKLKLVKQYEGSVLLNKWRKMAEPQFESILSKPPKVHTKILKDIQTDQHEVGITHKAIVSRVGDERKISSSLIQKGNSSNKMSQNTLAPESSLIVEMPSENGIDNPALESDDQQPHSDLRQSVERTALDPNSENGFIPFNVKWYNLKVSAYPPTKLFDSDEKKSIPIIKDVSGQVASGKVLAIMGASGAGKTTLLNVLTGRNLRNLMIEGKVFLNDKLSSIESLKACSAYVQQADLFIGVLTVREHLRFQAILRTNQGLSRSEVDAKVDRVLFELGLQKVAKTRIGIPGVSKSISGGEMKRLAFASEIITDPGILFCDEPTSGLDSFMAQSVVNVLKSMAISGRTVVCTIHQPSSEVFEMFDDLSLLAEGRVAFTGSSSEALEFFSRINLRCPQNYNPADFFIQQLAIMPGKEIECRDKVKMICDSFTDSEYNEKLKIPANITDSVEQTSPLFLGTRSSQSVYKRGPFTQYGLLTWRSVLSNLREPLITSVRISQTIFVSVLLGIVYWQQEYNQESIMNINGALFILLSNMTFVNVFSVVNTFCLELPVFVREHNNGLYSVGSYFLAKLTAEIPYFIILPILFSTISYWMIGLYADWHTFLLATAVFVLIANVSSGFGYLVSCLSKDVTMGLSIAPPLLIPLMLFGGLFINNASVPNYLKWIKYISWFYYGNEILVVNQWRNVENITCDYPSFFREQEVSIEDPVWKYISNTTTIEEVMSEVAPPECTLNGQGVIRRLNFEESRMSIDLIMLGVLLIVMRIIAFLSLSIRARLLR